MFSTFVDHDLSRLSFPSCSLAGSFCKLLSLIIQSLIQPALLFVPTLRSKHEILYTPCRAKVMTWNYHTYHYSHSLQRGYIWTYTCMQRTDNYREWDFVDIGYPLSHTRWIDPKQRFHAFISSLNLSLGPCRVAQHLDLWVTSSRLDHDFLMRVYRPC